jgi:hypothetical protein
MRHLMIAIGFAVANAGIVAVAEAQTAKHFDYSWAYDPISHQPILVCVDCWFYSCDCG